MIDLSRTHGESEMTRNSLKIKTGTPQHHFISQLLYVVFVYFYFNVLQVQLEKSS